MPLFYYLAVVGTPPATNGCSANAMYMYDNPEPFIEPPVNLNLNPFDRWSTVLFVPVV